MATFDRRRTSPGRDRRRRLTVEEARELYVRAKGRCQNCGKYLGADWHQSHLIPYSQGGATRLEDMQAWCPDCNLKLGPHSVEEAQGVVLRDWQREALPDILYRLFRSGMATLHAAPGAGKTLFAGAVFNQLYQAGLVERMVLVEYNLNLIGQSRDALAAMRIHLDDQPRDGVIEHPDTVGCVVTYQSLSSRGTVDEHITRMEQVPTLFVLDEVHHLAEDASWGRAVRRMVGDVAGGAIHAAAVLNMTGTLFRSQKQQRISTVRYQPVETPEGPREQALADYSVSTAQLIGRELRSPDLFIYGGNASVADVVSGEVTTGEIADLSRPQRNAVLREAGDSPDWLRGFCVASVEQLRKQLDHVKEEEPLKLLYVAQGQREARLAADMLNEVTRDDFSRLVISDEPGSLNVLRAAVRERRSLAIVSVQMVTEGFDCPEVSTIAYASNKTAELFVAQTMARAMRLTQTERATGHMLPAMIVVPDNPDLVAAFAKALKGALHIIEEPDDEGPTGPGPGPGPSLPRYQLINLDAPVLDRADVLGHEDGQVPAQELLAWVQSCLRFGIPIDLAQRVALASRQHHPTVRVYANSEGPRTAPMHPRDYNLILRSRLKKASGFMQAHIGHDSEFGNVQRFQALVNEAGGIASGNRDQATPDQLLAATQWACRAILRHCSTHHEPVPAWAREGSGNG